MCTKMLVVLKFGNFVLNRQIAKLNVPPIFLRLQYLEMDILSI